MASVVAVLQYTTSATALTVVVGLTVIVKDWEGPAQPLAEGVTVIVAVTGTLVLLMTVKALMSPLPLAARPMEGVLFVHAKVVPETFPVKETVEV
jgi:hypothetical protein